MRTTDFILTLISAHQFTENSAMWEKHPSGDEMVVLMSGPAEFLLRRKPGDESILLDEPGSFAIVPKDTWHTARIARASRMLFITPGEGTQNDTLPPAGN